MMENELYPWGGKFSEGNQDSPVAVVTLSDELKLPKEKVAIFGAMKTENLGVEKVIANIVSNPNIRYLIVCGREVRGHRSGDSIISIHQQGIDDNNRVIGAKSAIPYIENLPKEAIQRFKNQVEIIDLVDKTDLDEIISKINKCLKEGKESFGEPLIVPPIEKTGGIGSFTTDLGFHAQIDLDPYGYIHECKD